MTNEDRQTILAMITHGGSFARRLGAAAWTADSENLERIKTAFPETWERYEAMAKTIAERRRNEG